MFLVPLAPRQPVVCRRGRSEHRGRCRCEERRRSTHGGRRPTYARNRPRMGAQAGTRTASGRPAARRGARSGARSAHGRVVRRCSIRAGHAIDSSPRRAPRNRSAQAAREDDGCAVTAWIAVDAPAACQPLDDLERDRVCRGRPLRGEARDRDLDRARQGAELDLQLALGPLSDRRGAHLREDELRLLDLVVPRRRRACRSARRGTR